MNCIDQFKTDSAALYCVDSVEAVKDLPDNSIHYSMYSPPFAQLYSYSNSERDMGNGKDDKEFFEHFRFLVGEMLRATVPGRLHSFHCMDLTHSKERDGFIGIKDFPGDLIRAFQEKGWILHSKVVIWKNPLNAAVRTKALGLLHKQVCKDSAMVRQGIPDYLITMRKPGENPERIARKRGFERYIGGEPEPQEIKTDNHQTNKYSHLVWQRYASPVWMDICATETLQAIAEEDDARHICPLQLQVIERGIELWSNPGDVIFDPFAGIGSTGYQAIKQGRRFVGFELKKAYFDVAVKNLKNADAESREVTLLDGLDA